MEAETAIKMVRSWPSWYRRHILRKTRRRIRAHILGRSAAVRTVVLAAACGHADELGLPANTKTGRAPYNAYAHRITEARRSRPEELEELYRYAVDVTYSAQTLRPRDHRPWMTLLVAVRQQSVHPSLAPAMVKDFQLPEKEKRILRWIGQQVAYAHNNDAEDVRILVQAAYELLPYPEAAWEVLHTLTEDEGRLGRSPQPWTRILHRVRAARELVEG